MLDLEVLSRLQFAFTIAFHIIWPTINIGMGLFLLIIHLLYYRTQKQVYAEIYKFWVKIFALAFGIGVVTGIALSYQFGTNFSEYSRISGPVIGPLIGVEVMTAFFLEATFIGVMLFGWGRVSQRTHLLATILVVVGTHNSAFWILTANSWMQTPAGVVWENGVLVPESWWEIIFNPSMFYRIPHMLLASYLTGALLVCGVSTWYLLKERHQEFAQTSLRTAVLILALLAPLQIVMGDMHGLNTKEHQPAKLAAMEGLWDTTDGAPLLLFGIPDQTEERNHYELGIPYLGSLILTHRFDGRVMGLKEWPPEERPNVKAVFFSFRIMVGIGFLILFQALVGALLMYRKKLFKYRLYYYLCQLTTPLGFVAVLCGWFVTEIGRQPYVIYGLLKTKDALTPVMPAVVGVSLVGFIVVYMLLLLAFIVFCRHIIIKGPQGTTAKEDEWLKVVTHTSHLTEKTEEGK